MLPRVETARLTHTVRLWRVGPLVIAAALVANSVIREIALALFEVSPAFHHLRWGHLLSVTAVAVGAAVLVFAIAIRYARRPIRLYRRIAAVVLALSLIPDAAMFFADAPDHNPAAIIALMSMHVVDAAICVGLLPALTRVRVDDQEPDGEYNRSRMGGLR